MWSDSYTPTTSSVLLGISIPPYAIEYGNRLASKPVGAFLAEIQKGKPELYCAFGDSTYNAGYLQRIRSGFKSLIPGVNITTAQKICNCLVVVCAPC